MAVSRVGRRYAKALFRLAKGNEADQMEASLQTVKQLFELEESRKILVSPVMPLELKLNLFKYALDQADAPATVKNFVHTVAEAGRSNNIPDIIDSFSNLRKEEQGILAARVETAVAIDEAQLAKITGQLAKITNKKIEATTSVDASLLGGFVVRLGNSRVDLSVRARVDALSKVAAQSGI